MFPCLELDNDLVASTSGLAPTTPVTPATARLPQVRRQKETFLELIEIPVNQEDTESERRLVWLSMLRSLLVAICLIALVGVRINDDYYLYVIYFSSSVWWFSVIMFLRRLILRRTTWTHCRNFWIRSWFYIATHLVVIVLLLVVGAIVFKTSLRRFKSDRDEIWHDCSLSKFMRIDWRRTFKMTAMTSACRSLLQQCPPAAR